MAGAARALLTGWWVLLPYFSLMRRTISRMYWCSSVMCLPPERGALVICSRQRGNQCWQGTWLAVVL